MGSGKIKVDGRAFAAVWFATDNAVHFFDDLLEDVQAKPGALNAPRIGRVGLAELLENAIAKFLLADADLLRRLSPGTIFFSMTP